MYSLVETIRGALTAVGPGAEERVQRLIGEFDAVYLSGEEKLAAVATAIAATAWTHHLRYRQVYVDAVKTWALEISSQTRPFELCAGQEIEEERVLDAADVLIGGVDALIDWMGALPVRMQDRLVAELVVMARLLGRYDALSIHLTTLAIDQALSANDFIPGEAITIGLGGGFFPIGREADLEHLAPLGFA